MKYNIMFNNYWTTGLTSERQELGLRLFELKHPHTLSTSSWSYHWQYANVTNSSPMSISSLLTKVPTFKRCVTCLVESGSH